jgi:uncharacterized protein (TIGR00725 family)
MNIAIRPAEQADLATIIAIDLSVWDPRNTPAEDLGSRPPETCGTWIAALHGEVVGYFTLGRMTRLPSNRHVRQLRSLAVARPQQRRGIGRALVRAAADEARAGGARKLSLYVLASNDAARHLYAAEGFRLEARQRDEFLLGGVYVDSLILSLDLRRPPASPPAPGRKPIIAVIGNREASAAAVDAAEELGEALINAGYRLVSGGFSGVMEGVSRGARRAWRHQDGDILAILPGADPEAANPHVDIVLPSRLGYARNTLVVSTAAAVIAIGGGAGTLSEIAYAWQFDKPIIALGDAPGWALRLAGERLDPRRDDTILHASTASAAVRLLRRLLS